MRLIDADRLSEAIYDNVSAQYEDAVCAKEDCLTEIDVAPTVDAVPVVRCRECEYAFKSGSSITGIRCEVWGTYDLFHACEPDWFCSHGKRKEGAGNGP